MTPTARRQRKELTEKIEQEELRLKRAFVRLRRVWRAYDKQHLAVKRLRQRLGRLFAKPEKVAEAEAV